MMSHSGAVQNPAMRGVVQASALRITSQVYPPWSLNVLLLSHRGRVQMQHAGEENKGTREPDEVQSNKRRSSSSSIVESW